MINIIEYEDQYAADFRRLNLEWLEKYDLLESHDLMILDDPRGNVLDRGGFIYLALASPDPHSAAGQVVGTVALIHEHDDVYELAKMSVDPAFQGRGISKLLIEQCLHKAREIGAGKLTLWSNSRLQTAIHLYTRYGFQHVPVVDSPFATADVKMELGSI
ncbi:MAG TPA: GNAT family N-acetyltransferase [Puia sp.]